VTSFREPEPIPFNQPETAGGELAYVGSAIAAGRLAGNGPFARRCAAWLKERDLLLEDRAERDALIAALAAERIEAAFHYIPLHSSPAGRRFGRVAGPLTVTESVADRIVRLPLSLRLGADGVARVIDSVHAALRARPRPSLAA
jgi:dTDP-4-amino-4,6-dideoxygalactose transaminase